MKRFVLLGLLMAVFAFPAESLAATTLVGDTTQESYVDNNGQGEAQAYPYTASASGTAMTAYVYFDAANTSTNTYVGLYSNASGAPGTLLGQGVFTATTTGAWASATFSNVHVAAGETYWLALLSTAGSVYWRDGDSGTCAPSVLSSTNTLTSLPSTWSSGGTSVRCPGSIYLSGTVDPPTNTGAPAVTGTAKAGDTLTSTTGTWTGSPTSYSYAWQDCNNTGTGCTTIPGATSSTYTLAVSDVAETVRSVVTASNAGGSSSPASSAATPLVLASGTTYYVAPSGASSCAGSTATAPCSFQAYGSTTLSSGQAVLFEGGQTFPGAVYNEVNQSGTAASPITLGSYGTGNAVFSDGFFFLVNYIDFKDLTFNDTLQGGSDNGPVSVTGITIDAVTINPSSGSTHLGLYGRGTSWTIENSTIENTGLSGIQIFGDGYTITGNTINNVGLYDSGYPAHGIYLDASDANIQYNTITNCSESCVSARYHNSTIENNTLSNAESGIDFYQTDATAGTSYWENNTISGTTAGAIYVSNDGTYSLRESFVIENNAMTYTSGVGFNLYPTSGTYTITGNTCNGAACS